jgi:RimJ/RimL family protein N-acetyltransferase
MTDPELPPTSDGLIVIQPPQPGDARILVAGRDEAFDRWLGPGSDTPHPVACIHVGGRIVGWADYDHDADHDWLQPDEVNVGYNVFAADRGHGYATRAVQLLIHHLALRTGYRTASLAIRPDNRASIALASRIGAVPAAGFGHGLYFRRSVPPLSYSDGVVTVRRPLPSDLQADLEAKDDEQIKWMWRPGERERWGGMTPAQQATHVAGDLRHRVELFGAGPKWTFSVDAPGADNVAYVDCDLANEHVPWGEANIAYSCHRPTGERAT